jgi:hypothetical protein
MSTWGRTALARAAALSAALPLAGGVLIAAAPAAGAAVTSPGNGTVFTSYSSFRISASYPASGSSHRLELASPGGPSVTVATAPADRLDGGTMSYDLDTGCWTYPSPSCSGRRLAPNGTWTVTQSGGASGSSTFVTRIRPEAPTGVSASAISSREVRVSWRAGDEPDLTGWSVLEGDQVVRDGIGRSACDGSACSSVISYATEGTGDHSYAVVAHRSVAPGSSSTLESPPSQTASARLEAPPPPPEEPPAGGETGGAGTGSGTGGGGQTGGETGGETGSGTGSGTGGGTGSGGGGQTGGEAGSGGTGGSTGGSTSGGSTGGSGSGSGGAAPIGTGGGQPGVSADAKAVAQRKAFALGFSAFGPKLGIPKLPPLPQAQAPAIAPELEDGTFEPTLGFEDQVLTERVPIAQQGPTERVRSVVGSALDSERLLRSSAVALVLVLAAAHLRRWLGSSREADEH